MNQGKPEIAVIVTGLTCVLTITVIVLGAYTRLTDAGLGCPDWPGCYGYWTVPMTEEAKVIALQRYPETALDTHKAWNEMLHRYLASSLGVMIFITSACVWKHGSLFQKRLCGALMGLVLFQGYLGMLTVTMALMPLVVMGHLLGGFTIFACLAVLLFDVLQGAAYRKHSTQQFASPTAEKLIEQRYRLNLRASGLSVGIALLLIQIALGGWTSANYAALSCVEFPICHQGWQTEFSVQQALAVPHSAESYEFGVKSPDARMSIHVLHRLGALMVVSWFSLYLLSQYRAQKLMSTLQVGQITDAEKRYTMYRLVTLLLGIQVLLGMSNVWFLLPIGVAVLHNLVACVLFAACVVWRYSLLLEQRCLGQASVASELRKRETLC